MTWRKQDTGLEPSRKNTFPQLALSPHQCCICEASLKKGLEVDIDTFKFCALCADSVAEDPFVPCTPTPIGNPQEVELPTTMSGKKTPELKEASLNWDASPKTLPKKRTGTPFVNAPRKEDSTTSPQIFMYVATTSSAVLAKIMFDQMVKSELSTCFGVELELASHAVLGKKPVFRLIAKIQDPSGGMDMLLNDMWYSMNFEEVSTWPISYAGSTVIRSEWKEKVDRFLYARPHFG